MDKFLKNKLYGVGFYVLAMISLHQVIAIPLIALILIFVIYKSRSTLAKAHAKYMLSIFAAVSLVVLVAGNFFAKEESVVALLVAVSMAFLMLGYGAFRIYKQRHPISTMTAAKI